MNDPSVFTTQIKTKLTELRDLIAPAQVKDFEGAIRKCSEIQLLAALAKAEFERMQKNEKETA